VKKPTRLTQEQLEEVVAKRADRKVKVNQQLPSGNWEKISKAIDDFAEKWGVHYNDVHISNSSSSYYSSRRALMVVSRPETPEEKFKRVKREEDDKYRTKKYNYDAWVRTEKYKREQAAYQAQQQFRQVVKKSVVCCNQCGCTCCN
jgi:hypothetical protein